MKANPDNGQDRYVVGGLCVPLELIAPLENDLNDLAEKTFGTRDLTPRTEFHASHIYFGKGAFKGRKVEERVAVLAALGEILNAYDGVRRVYRKWGHSLIPGKRGQGC